MDTEHSSCTPNSQHTEIKERLYEEEDAEANPIKTAIHLPRPKLKYFIKGGTNRKWTLRWRQVNFVVFLCAFIDIFVRYAIYDHDLPYALCYLTNISMGILVLYLGVGIAHA